MANDTTKPMGKALAEDTTPAKQTVHVNSISKNGFRRLDRYFGPESVEVEVTDEELAVLLAVPNHLRVLPADMKAKLDELAKPKAAKAKDA